MWLPAFDGTGKTFQRNVYTITPCKRTTKIINRMARSIDAKQTLVVDHAAAMLDNLKLSAGLRAKLIDLLDRATARQHEGNLEKARLRDAAQQRAHELRLAEVKSDSDLKELINQTIDERIAREKEKNGSH